MCLGVGFRVVLCRISKGSVIKASEIKLQFQEMGHLPFRV